MQSLRLDGDQDRLDNIEELLNSVRLYEHENANEESVTLSHFLQDIALYTNMDYKQDSHFVKLMTVHQAKGLEFKFVFICGMSEGVFPSHRSLRERKKEALEEERRLAYVAVTRAEEELYITESEGYYSETGEKLPSRFIFEIKESCYVREGVLSTEIIDASRQQIKRIDDEIDEKIISFRDGDLVKHKIFGIGKVFKVSKLERTYWVKFEAPDGLKPISFDFRGLERFLDVQV